MEQYIIKGGNPLVGEVEIGGAKNAALGILAAAIMADEPVLIENLPDVNDINVMLEAIEGIGAMVQRIDRHTVKINGSTIGDFSIDYDYIKKIRASYYLLGALLGKYKRAEVALPGGCNIGSRPIDQHLKGFRALGADVDIEYGKIVAEAEHLKGTHLYFDVVTVGATINVMMAAAMADGITIMENVAKEPHVVDVANFLNSMGANIRGAGTDVIKIRGVKSLHKAEYSIIPDQIEAGTFMFAAAATRGDVTVLNVIPKHLDATISKLIDIGCEVEEFDDAVRVVAKGRLKSTQVKTLPYPGYPTDMQPQIGVQTPTSSLSLLSVSSVIFAPSGSELMVIASASMTISFFSIPYFAASAMIFFATCTLPSASAGIPFSSSASPITTPPYFWISGNTLSIDSCFPLTELTIAFPL